MGSDHNTELVNQIIDGLSIATLIGSLTNVLPEVAVIFTIIWTGIRIYESDTVQRLLKRSKQQ